LPGRDESGAVRRSALLTVAEKEAGHAVAESPNHEVAPAVEALDDPEAAAAALRHLLIGGVHAVEDCATEVAEAEGEPLRPHEATKIIGEMLSELD
jgi:hypothetical protein